MLLLVNIDDISGELIPHTIDGLMARGAASVHVVPAITKKGRPEHLFFIDAPEEQVEPLAWFLAEEFGTLGVRVFEPHHIHFSYRVCQVSLTATVAAETMRASIQVKQVLGRESQVIAVKAEHRDLHAAYIRLNEVGAVVSLMALKRLVEQAAQGREACSLGPIQASYQP